MSVQDDALAYLGLADVVDLSSQSFTVSDYAGCTGALAELLVALGAAADSCGFLAPLLVGEIVSDGIETPLLIIAGAKCYLSFQTYAQKAKALSSCVSAVNGGMASQVASAADTIASALDQTATQAQAMVDQQQATQTA